MSSRPRSNDSRKLQGVQKKAKEKARKEKQTPKHEIEKARDDLTAAILSNLPDELRGAFDLYSNGIEPRHLMGLLGVEITRLQHKQATGDYDYRDATHFHRTMDQARRIQAMHQGSNAYIPDKINVELHAVGVDPEEEDFSDKPEFA